MEIFKLKAEKKNLIGGPNARRMRREGKVPAVIYGHGDNVMCSLPEKDLRDLLITPKVYLVELDLEGTIEHVLVKDVQFHPVSDRPIHLDFYRYVEDEPVTVAIPVVLQGHSIGVKAGGRLFPGIRKLKVKGLAKDLPDFLPVDITKLKIGDILLVHSVSFPNLEVVDTKNLVIASIKSQRGAAAVADIEEESEAESVESNEETGGEKQGE